MPKIFQRQLYERVYTEGVLKLFKPVILLFLLAVVIRLSTPPLFSIPTEEEMAQFRQAHVAKPSQNLPVFDPNKNMEAREERQERSRMLDQAVDGLTDRVLNSIALIVYNNLLAYESNNPDESRWYERQDDMLWNSERVDQPLPDDTGSQEQEDHKFWDEDKVDEPIPDDRN